jgi:hypothetical protein
MSARGLRAIVAVGAVLGLLLPASLTQAAKGPACPTFSPSNFSKPTRVTNSYFPLRPGDLYTYKGNRKRVPVVDTVYVTTNPRTIDGVNVVEVRDQVSEGGIPTEDTLDWYAQDNQGNVWYFGEYTTQLPAGTHTGSWTAGVDGAQPGYIMEAAPPTVGDTYCQENAPGIAEDAGQVVSITASRSVPYNSYSGNVVQTKDYSLIEPHSEYKFYGPGVGLLEAIALNGGNEDLQLYSLEHNQ